MGDRKHFMTLGETRIKRTLIPELGIEKTREDLLSNSVTSSMTFFLPTFVDAIPLPNMDS